MTPEHTALLARLIGPVAADVEAALRALSQTVSEKEGEIKLLKQPPLFRGVLYEKAKLLEAERDAARASVATLTARAKRYHTVADGHSLKVSQMIDWLHDNQPDVFDRGLRDLIHAANLATDTKADAAMASLDAPQGQFTDGHGNDISHLVR